MFKVLLVDDESWVVESLKDSVNWQENGFEIIGMAYNGLEALKMIKELMPNLVFTDIRMPGMTGLDLIKKVKESEMEVQFIVASGYAEFAYAQKAINYGALGYCVKPFDEAEIIDCLNRVKRIYESKVLVSEIESALLFEDSNNIDDEKIKLVLENAGISVKNQDIIAIVSYGKDKLQFPEEVKSLSVKIGVHKWVYILNIGEVNSLKSYLIRHIPESVKAIGISGKISGIHQIHDAVEEASAAALSFFISDKKKVYEAKYDNLKELRQALKQLEEAIKIKDLSSINENFDLLKKLFENSMYSIKHAFYTYNMAMSFIYQFVNESHETFVDNYVQLLSLFNNVNEMLNYLRDSIINQVNMKAGNTEINVENETIKEILNYVNMNFYTEISIQSISQKFFINPNYVSYLFKKEVGLNYTEYLTKLRIDLACKLLKESKLTIQMISEKSGYNDYFYFTRIFKKVMGMTPNEYRNESN